MPIRSILSELWRKGLLVALTVILGVTSWSHDARAFEEVSTWPCHWPYSSGTLYLPYTWKGDLISPGNTAQSNIKTAFGYSVADWNATDTVVNFYLYGPTDVNWLFSYHDESMSALGGYVDTYCYPNPGDMAANDVFKNEVGVDTQDPSTEIRAATGHELGHALGIGHGSVEPSLMGDNPDPSTYYVPLDDDEDAVNHYY